LVVTAAIVLLVAACGGGPSSTGSRGSSTGSGGSPAAAGPPQSQELAFARCMRAHGVTDIEEHRFLEEDIEFRLPVELRRELALADAQR